MVKADYWCHKVKYGALYGAGVKTTIAIKYNMVQADYWCHKVQ